MLLNPCGHPHRVLREATTEMLLLLLLLPLLLLLHHLLLLEEEVRLPGRHPCLLRHLLLLLSGLKTKDSDPGLKNKDNVYSQMLRNQEKMMDFKTFF